MNGTFNKPVVSSIGSYLLTRNETIAVAESVTWWIVVGCYRTANDARHFIRVVLLLIILGNW